MNCFEIITSITAIASVIIATIAIVQSNKQIKLSNKQNLFNSRVHSYFILKGLIELYKQNKEQIEENKKDEIYFYAEFLYLDLINNSYLEEISGAIGNPLHSDYQKKLLKKLEEMRVEATKFKFLYTGEIAEKIETFIKNYANFLMGLYQYRVLLDSMDKISKQIPIKDIHEVAKEVDEKKHRDNLFSYFSKLIDSYDQLEKNDIEKELEEQIKIKD